MPVATFTVRVDVPLGSSFGVTMNQVRSWLDSTKIQTTNFRPVSAAHGVAFELTFGSEQDAQRFKEYFPSATPLRETLRRHVDPAHLRSPLATNRSR